MNDFELLGKYIREASQDAFRQLVERHANIVYSTARRILSDSHWAEDVTQQVFALLARKAQRLPADTVLPGWLYRAARNVAFETLRRERRRQKRERTAAEALSGSGSRAGAGRDWEQIEPLLDDAMAALGAFEHDAIVLRYFQKKSLKEVGEALGWSEDAAQKRVARALSRLHRMLVRRGVTVALAGLGAAVSEGAVQSAPAGLIASALAASADVVAAGGLSSAADSVYSMATAKLKWSMVGAVAVVLSLFLVFLWQENARLRQEMETLRGSVALERGFSEPSSSAQDASDELRRLRMEHWEVLGLRARLAQLSKELRQRSAPDTQTNIAEASTQVVGDSLVFTAATTNRVSSGNTLVIGGWSSEGMRGYLLATPVVQPGDSTGAGQQIGMQTQVVGAPDSFWEQIGWGAYKSDTRRSALAGVLVPEQIDALSQMLKDTEGAEFSNISSVTNREGERMSFAFSMDDGDGPGLLMNIGIYPRIAPDGNGVDLELVPATPSAEAVHSSLK